LSLALNLRRAVVDSNVAATISRAGGLTKQVKIQSSRESASARQTGASISTSAAISRQIASRIPDGAGLRMRAGVTTGRDPAGPLGPLDPTGPEDKAEQAALDTHPRRLRQRRRGGKLARKRGAEMQAPSLPPTHVVNPELRIALSRFRVVDHGISEGPAPSGPKRQD
jgi:hypothetical protein